MNSQSNISENSIPIQGNRKLAIIKYNAGNVQSVLYALKRLGYSAIITDDERELRNADKVIFPGVGNAGAAMESLQQAGLDKIIPTLKQPVLGICVGMQLLCNHSEESNTKCLGIIDTSVKKFIGGSGVKVPQMGWNTIYDYKSDLLKGLPENSFVYYVHSYYAESCVETVATTDYVLPYTAIIQKNNFYGVQFHTEKSADVGDKILSNFSGTYKLKELPTNQNSNDLSSPLGDRGSSFIIPAIDIINGKAVRLTHGDYTKEKIYYNQPVDAAKEFEDAGLSRLHLVDLDGAKAGAIQNLKVLEEIATATRLQIDFGGGVKKEQDIKDVMNAGAAMVTIGSLAVKQPDLLAQWIAVYGSEKFFIGADVYEEKIKISGWLQDGGIGIFDFLENMLAIGVTQFFCTDIQKDGAMQGASVDLYKKIITQFPAIELTASGGVTTINDIELVKQAGCSGAIIGKAIYEGLISLQDLKRYN